MKRRYRVERCDECGTLADPDGNPIDHTWSVVDRTTGREVSNHDTRAVARRSARELEHETP